MSERPLTDFLLAAAADPALHAELTKTGDELAEFVNSHLPSDAAQALLSGVAQVVADYVQGEHAGAGRFFQHEVQIGDDINLLICFWFPNLSD